MKEPVSSVKLKHLPACIVVYALGAERKLLTDTVVITKDKTEHIQMSEVNVLAKLTQSGQTVHVMKAGSVYRDGQYVGEVMDKSVPGILDYITDVLCEQGWRIVEIFGMSCTQGGDE